MDNKPALDYIRSVISYDEATGVLQWKKTLGSRARAGEVAGSQTARGHLVLRVSGHLLLAHHVAWAMHKGEWPAGLVQHVNGDYSDNRMANLIATTKREVHAGSRAEAITAENVHAIFRYRAGHLYWRESLSGKHRVAGKVAGYVSADGYVKVEVGGKAQSAHRIVWLMHRGEWPSGDIDHINGDRADNRIGNLRDVTHRLNTQNRRKAVRGSCTGHLGVTLHQSGRFRARIRADGKLMSLGLYDTPQQAHAAYVVAKRRLHAGNTL